MPIRNTDVDIKLYQAAFTTVGLMFLWDYLLRGHSQEAAVTATASVFSASLVLAFMAITPKLLSENHALLQACLPDPLITIINKYMKVNIRAYLQEAIELGDQDPRYPLVMATALSGAIGGEAVRRISHLPLPPGQSVGQFATSLATGFIVVSIGQKLTTYPGALLGHLADLQGNPPRQAC